MEPLPSLSQSRAGRWIFVCILLIVGLLLYAKALQAPFFLDDAPTITLRSSWPQWHELPSQLWRDPRAVVTASLSLNHAVGELNPWGYHLFNVLVHLANSLLLWGLVRRTLLECSESLKTRAGQLAFGVSLLWMIHPLASQPVVYVIQRAELMMATAYLVSLYALVRGYRAPKQTRWSILVVMGCVVGLYTKQVAATIPLAALLYDRTFLAGTFTQALRTRRWMYVGLLASWSILFITGTTTLLDTNVQGASAGLSMQAVMPLQYLFVQSEVILHYLRLCVWPDVLIFDYGWPPQPINAYFFTFAITACLFAMTVWLVWHRPKVGFLPACVFLILGPTSSLVPITDMVAEHRMYLPLAAVVLMAVLLLHGVCAKQRKLFLFFLVVAGLLLGGRTWVRLDDYRDGVTLWKTVVQASPTFARGRIHLGSALMRSGELDDAAYQYEQAIADHRGYATPYNHLGRYWLLKGDVDKAMGFVQQAVELSEQSNADYLSHLAHLYRLKGNLPEASRYYQLALKVNPRHPETLVGLAAVLLQLGQPREAIRYAQQSPDNPDALLGLASAHAMLGQWAQADEAFALLLAIQPNHLEALQRRAWLLATCPDDQVRQGTLAIELAQQGLTLCNGRNLRLWDALGAAYAEAKQFKNAINVMDQAIQLARQQPQLVKRFEARKQLYQRDRPYRLGDKK